MKSFLQLFPFLILTVFFFYSNPDLDRGEYGSWDYTITKCLPILALTLTALFTFDQPNANIRTGIEMVDKLINYQHPAVLAFFTSTIGDYFLANRSNCMTDFTLGIIPFGISHYLNTKSYASKSLTDQKLWWPAIGILTMHSAIVGLATLPDMIRRTSLVFQVLTFPYAILLAWTVYNAMANWYYGLEKDKDRSKLIYMLGYISFMLSDSMIMLDEFCLPVPRSQVLILITYYAAQALIFLSFSMTDAKMKTQ